MVRALSNYCTNIIFPNYAEVVRGLDVVQEDKTFDAEDIAKSMWLKLYGFYKI